jgi:hypothetical protein
MTPLLTEMQEIHDIVKNMRNNAAPGPDGLNAAFYKATWAWTGKDVLDLIKNFYNTGYMPPDINNTHIALIPKNNNPVSTKDYRPISLCNIIYKIIAKSLADRIKHHLPNIIHPSQNAFIQGRNIATNIIIVQEIVHSFCLKSWKQKAFLLKLDLAKAFDRIEWNFIVKAKDKGGLGIRDIYKINESLLVYVAWNIATDNNSFLTKVLKAKYFPNCSFWTVTNDSVKSIFWSSIMKIRHYLHENCTVQIHNGCSSIWSSPWRSIWNKIHDHINLPVTVDNLPNKIFNRWNPHSQTWNADLLLSISDEQATREITIFQLFPLRKATFYVGNLPEKVIAQLKKPFTF